MGTDSFAVITPVRDEAENLPRLAESLCALDAPPSVWVVVDNGSVDGSRDLVRDLAREHAWIRLCESPPDPSARRGAASVRALHAGIASLTKPVDYVANLDADVSLPPDYFSRIIAAFEANPSLGIASGVCLERGDSGRWERRAVTGDTVWGAARLYRRACLDELLPLQERFASDSMAQLKANARGWQTQRFPDLVFWHHRPEGHRDDGRLDAWTMEGRSAHYMGYRVWYLLLRTAHHVSRGEVAAVGILWGFSRSALAGEPRVADPDVRAALKRQQDPRKILRRMSEARRA